MASSITASDLTVTIKESAVSDNIESLALDTDTTKYIRVTNLDTSNSCNLSLQIDNDEDDSGADEQATFLLAAGHSLLLGTSHDSACVATSASIDVTFHDIESILIDPVGNAIDVEIFVAST